MPRFAANLSMLFTEVPFLDRFERAAAAGFEAVEFLFPYAWPAAQIRERLQRHRLRLVLHNLPAGDWDGGERGIACLPDRVDEFRTGVATALDYARELGVEAAADHAFAVQFQDSRRSEAAHQRLPHLRRVGAGARREQQGLRHRLDVQRDDDLVGHLRGLAVAVAPHQRDVPAHQLEQRAHAFEYPRLAADHDGQRGVARADLAARHRRVEVVAAEFADALREFLGRDRGDRAHVDHDLVASQAFGHAAGPEQHDLHVRRVRQHQEHDVGLARHLGRRGAAHGRAVDDGVGVMAARVHEQLMPGGDQVRGHRRAHDAQADESESSGWRAGGVHLRVLRAGLSR